MSNKREPIHEEAINKKKKIISKGFELMCNKGYYNTTCIDIAKYVGVSTGIIYQYFDDKRDIFIEGVKEYYNNIVNPMIDVLTSKGLSSSNVDGVLREVISKFVHNHTISSRAHEELMAMSYLDSEVGDIFKNNEINMSEEIVKYLNNNGFNIPNIHEKVHLIIGIVNNYCHDVVYHKHKVLDYSSMEDEVIKTIKFILEIK